MKRKTEDGGEEPGLYTNRQAYSLAILSWLLLGSSVRRNLEAEPSRPGYPVCLEAEGRQAVGRDAPDTPPSIIWDCGVSDVARAFLGSPDGGDLVMLLETLEHFLPRVGQHVYNCGSGKRERLPAHKRQSLGLLWCREMVCYWACGPHHYGWCVRLGLLIQ